MGTSASHIAFKVLGLGILSALCLTQPLRAKECDLAHMPQRPIDAAPTTTFLPSGGTGQILIRWQEPSIVRVFEVDSLDPTKQLSEAAVTSVTQAPENTYKGQGFDAGDSIIVRFTVPERADTFWERRTFILRLCGKGDDKAAQAWATISPRVSNPFLAKVISVVALLLLYAAFCIASYSKRTAEHPLQMKWPAYEPPKEHKWWRYLDPVVLTAGLFNNSSIQKLQVLLFTLLVGGLVLTLVLTAGFLPTFSPTVMLLLGISAVGAAVATKTTSNNERLKFENWAWLVKREILPITRQETPRWADLVMTGREFDVYKLQTLLFSGVVAVALLLTGGGRLDTFTVPETLLGILGLSQVVYIAGTLVRPPSVSDLDKAITELREIGAKIELAVAYNVDTDTDGKLPTKLPDRPAAPPTLQQRIASGMNVMTQYKKKADQVEIMLESTLEADVDRTKLDYP